MLFYYFNNKRELYLYLVHYCLQITEQHYFNFIDSNERDLFERLKKTSLVKMEFLKKYPNAMNFLATIFLNDPLEDELKKQIEELQKKGYAKIYGDIDYSLFRDDIEGEKALKLIQWTFRGYEEEIKYRLKDQKIISIDYQPYFEEFFSYLDMMKVCFYKEDFHQGRFSTDG